MSKQQQVLFTLRPEFEEGFDGGNVALWDGTSYDVKAALDAGKGTITLDPDKDEQLITVLAGYQALQHEIVTAKAATRGKGGDS